MTDSVESFSTMLRKALGDRIDADAGSFVEMMAEDGVMEFPFSPPGFPTRFDGRAAIASHLERLRDLIVFDRMSEPVIHATTDPNTVVLEFAGFGRSIATTEPYDQTYISVIRTEVGRIIHYRDYWNPIPMLRAARGSAVIDALLSGGAGHE